MNAAVAATPGAHRRPGRSGRTGGATWWRVLLVTAVVVGSLAVLAAYVFPTRTWLDQRSALAQTDAQLRDIDAERDALQQRIDQLDTDAEIEQIARSQFGLVRPGEEAYSVLPAPEQPVAVPDIWPFGVVGEPADAASTPAAP